MISLQVQVNYFYFNYRCDIIFVILCEDGEYKMLTDIEIAQNCKPKPIIEIAKKLKIFEDELELYGKYKAKLTDSLFNRLKNNNDGKLILVTAINPTPAGEGKTTTTIGLGQAMAKINKNAIIALREPSLGPVFGVKGGATGGGYSQVLPMEDINLHFTGDMHAITSANNLLCALLDNHIQQGNLLNIDTRRILIKRCLDMNDRALRNIVVGLGGKTNGIPREDGFIITVASEVMAILCLATDLFDLKERLGKILIAYSYDDKPIFAKDINANGAMVVLLKEAFKPNLIQTLEGTPAIMHGGPFANIAHGCNSIRATKLALKLADYCITEAGFGSDLGAEKFFDIKCRFAKLNPAAVVIVATTRALKYNGGVKKDLLKEENLNALKKGIVNLGAHIKNMQKFGIPVVVAINKFSSDTQTELNYIKEFCLNLNVDFAVSEVFEKGGDGGADLARVVCNAAEKKSKFKLLYDENLSIKEKIEIICKKIYGANNINYTEKANKAIQEITELKADKIPICIAKTQYSFSDNPNLLGAPNNFDITVKNVKLSNGAGFIVVFTGDIMTMPGLSKNPAANNIDIDENLKIIGLF